MTTFPPFAHQSTSLLGVLAAAIFLMEGGCKPPPPTGNSQATPPDAGSASRQPTAADFQAFFQTMLPADVKVSEVKMDTPTRLPNAAPGSNTWLLATKITLAPAEDLFALPSAQDTQPIDNLVAELNALIAWRNAYAASSYAKVCGAFEVKVPAAPLPQLLVLTHTKDHPLPPIYAKVTAEWQVDHWQFEPAQGNIAPPDPGKLRSEFTGPTIVKGSPEADNAIGGVHEAVVQARKEIEAIRGRYAEQVTKGTKPGTTYQGRVAFRQNVQPCELRFLAPPPGADAHYASLEVKLPNENPPCTFTYNAKVTTELPIPVPGAQPTPARQNPAFDFDDSNRVPGYNIRLSLVRSAGKMDEHKLPGQILVGNNHDMGGQTLLLLDGHVEGVLSYYNAPGITVSVDHVNP